MQISKTSQYAIRALIFINQNSTEYGERVSLKEIASGIDSPEHFTAKLIQPLAKQDVLESIKGPGGGFCVHKDTGSTTVRQIIEIIEGKDFFNKCFLGLSGCSDEKPCPAHFQYKILKQDSIDLFERLTIESMTSNLEENENLFRLIG